MAFLSSSFRTKPARAAAEAVGEVAEVVGAAVEVAVEPRAEAEAVPRAEAAEPVVDYRAEAEVA